MDSIRVAVLTVSDRASDGRYEDLSGPALVRALEQEASHRYTAWRTAVVPDEVGDIVAALRRWSAADADGEFAHVILTTGGTGFAPRDVTPEATMQVIEREAPGITAQMLTKSLQITPHAMLSRGRAGIVASTIIVNLPGSPKAAVECLSFIIPALKHAVYTLLNLQSSHRASSSSISQSSTESSISQSSTESTISQSTISQSTISQSSTESTSEHQGCSCFRDDGDVSERDSPYPLVSEAEALRLVLEHTGRNEAVLVDVQSALHCVLAEDVVAREPVPAFAASMKDGYAVRSSCPPGDYAVSRSIAAAGYDGPCELPADSVAQIATGAPLPLGADAVVMVEDTQLLEHDDDTDSGEVVEKRVRILHAVRAGSDVRPVGSDVAAGAVVLRAGASVGYGELALLASLGERQVRVYRPPRVGLLSTGNEVVAADEAAPLRYGQVRDSNRVGLRALVEQASGGRWQCVDGGIVPDELGALRSALARLAADVDVVVTSGGVSMGHKDLLKAALAELGTVHFGRVRVKPGKPLTFATVAVPGRRQPTLVFAAPGNPVSALVMTAVFAVPALRKLAGLAQPLHPRVRAVAASPLRCDPQRDEYHRGVLVYDSATARLTVTSTGNQLSSRLLSMASANALIHLPRKNATIQPGQQVDVLIIGHLLSQ